MARSRSLTVVFACTSVVASLTTAIACGGGKLGSPKSDQNFDDPDNPNQTMPGTLPDAALDVVVPDGSGATCTKPADCLAPLRCIYPIALGCGTKGTCALYTDSPGCAQKQACACDGNTVSLCAPDGYANAPIEHAGVCVGTPDAAPADASPE
jgi:hypothetical protein